MNSIIFCLCVITTLDATSIVCCQAFALWTSETVTSKSKSLHIKYVDQL